MVITSTIEKLDIPIDQTFHQLESKKVGKWEATLSPDYWEYRRKWNENPTHHITGSFPIHLDIEATNACNLRCIMCPRTSMIENGSFWNIGRFDLEIYKDLIDEGVANGLCSIKYNILGEPLLNPRLVEMIKYAKRAGVIDVMFNTNATCLTEEISRQLIKSGLDKLFFSFDSPYPEQYNRIRIGSDYDKVLANIRQFNEIREEMGSIKPFTRVSMVVMKGNENAREDYRKLFEPIVDAVAYLDYNNHANQNNPELMPDSPPKTRRGKYCCPQLWQRMFVHSDGVVMPCCNDTMRDLKVGNIFEQSASEIWLGEYYQRLRNLHASGRFAEIPTCANCSLAH